MRKSGLADIGGLLVRRAVKTFIQHPRQRHQLRQVFLGDACLIAKLENKRWDQRDQVGIAAPLAKSVDGALHLARAGADGGQRVGHRHPRVIMAVNAKTRLGNRLANGADNLEHFRRQRAAIGIAQHHP